MYVYVCGGGGSGNHPVHAAGIQLRKMPVSSTSCMLGSCYKLKVKNVALICFRKYHDD